MGQVAVTGTEFRYVSSTGEAVITTLEQARSDLVASGRPVRRFPWHAGMRHYPGWWWSATIGDLVGYESLLERDRLLLADFDCAVMGIASQPFGISGRDGDTIRRHVPDYLLRMRDGSVVVVDVKPAELLEKPKVANVLAWTGRLLAERAWRYEVFTGCVPVRLTNLRLLAQGRHAKLSDDEGALSLLQVSAAGMPLSDASALAQRRSGLDRRWIRGALLALLWQQRLIVDLDRPLDGSTVIQGLEEVDRESRCA